MLIKVGVGGGGGGLLATHPIYLYVPNHQQCREKTITKPRKNNSRRTIYS